MYQILGKILKQLPNAPGVYQFFNRKKEVIYVGKAAVLKNRVRSYFSKNVDHSPAKSLMLHEISGLRVVKTDSEIEALLLEANFIKKLKPKYNVIMRDDKSYLYIKVSTEEEWPRVFATRTIEKVGTYFGPFTSAHAVRETLRVLRKFLPYRCNQKPIDLKTSLKIPLTPPLEKGEMKRDFRRGRRACFWYHLGRCPGTCIGAITKTEYRKTIRRILLFLGGKMKDVRRVVKKELGSGRVALMENVLAHTRILSVTEKYAGDVKELARLLHLSKPPERIEGYDISNIMGREVTGAMVVFVNGEPTPSEYKRFKIKTVHGADDVKMLAEVLQRRFRHSQWSNVNGQMSDVWPLPDLMVIDGGKAQLNTAVRVCRRFQGGSRLRSNSISTIPVIAVAKGGHGGVLAQKEEIYFPGEKQPLKLPNSAPALHLILRVRDEAHRFAIGYHTLLRKRKMYR